MDFKLVSNYQPTGDQPTAIKQLLEGLQQGEKYQTLLGVTGSGKTFTTANVIAQSARPTLVLAHNKTLAAQLYSEYKQFFPENAVEYFVSYYDYYQPEAFIPTTNTYIEKDLSINDEIEKMRLSATSSLLSGRRDVIVVASVSCLFGIGNPHEFKKNIMTFRQDQEVSRTSFLQQLVHALYARTEEDFDRGHFRIKGDTIAVFPTYTDYAIRFHFFGDEIELIESFDSSTQNIIEELSEVTLYPANLFVTSPEVLHNALDQIALDLGKQVQFFQNQGKKLEAKRIEERTNFDLEMIKELGYCSGIENYSRYMDGRLPGTRPFCLLDYFPEDYLLIVDESHVTIPQTHAMYGGDRSRKESLVEYGFRLPSAMDNRPLKFEEFESVQNQVIYVSATPADYELRKSQGVYVEQIIRPTGLLDPLIEVRPTEFQIDDLVNEIQECKAKGQRVLITTLTKRMAEELSKYLLSIQIKCNYIHSDIDTLERVEIMHDLRKGIYDVLIGVNLLREGLDLPEVALVAILDADKEGFLRNYRSMIQTIGRAARNTQGRAILYADKMTKSMQCAIDDTVYRRAKQQRYNKTHHIEPKELYKPLQNPLNPYKSKEKPQEKITKEELSKQYKNTSQIQKAIKEAKSKMEEAAKLLDFLTAARFRDEMRDLKALLKERQV